jgi:transposase
MSLKPQAFGPIPQPTIEVAKAAFPKGNTYMKMRDEMGVFFEDEQFSALFSSRGQPALSPWRLALVTIMQDAENLTDRQAADAVRGRIDWKYARNNRRLALRWAYGCRDNETNLASAILPRRRFR